MYVVVMMALVEALAPNGTLLGAFFTLVLYGLLPLAIVLYVMGTPARRRARRKLEASATAPDGSDQTLSGAVAPERKEP